MEIKAYNQISHFLRFIQAISPRMDRH